MDRLIKNNSYFNYNYYECMKNKNNKELLDILKNTVKQLNFNLNKLSDDINNFDNLGHYDKHKLINNDLGCYECLLILVCLLRDKNNL